MFRNYDAQSFTAQLANSCCLFYGDKKDSLAKKSIRIARVYVRHQLYDSYYALHEFKWNLINAKKLIIISRGELISFQKFKILKIWQPFVLYLNDSSQ